MNNDRGPSLSELVVLYNKKELERIELTLDVLWHNYRWYGKEETMKSLFHSKVELREQLEEKLAQVRGEGNQAQMKRVQWMLDAAKEDATNRFNLYYLSEELEGQFLFLFPFQSSL